MRRGAGNRLLQGPALTVFPILVGLVTVGCCVGVTLRPDLSHHEQPLPPPPAPMRWQVDTHFTHGTPTCQACTTLQAAIDAAISRGDTSYTVPPPGDGSAAYAFGSSSLTISGATDFVVVLDGTTNGSGATWAPSGDRGAAIILLFDIGGGVALLGCTNVTIRGGVVDYLPTVAQGTVAAVDLSPAAPFVTADFDPAFLKPDPTVTPFFSLEGSIKVAFWDRVTKTMIRSNASSPSAINIFAKGFTPLGPWRYRVHITGNLLSLGGIVTSGTPITVFPRGGQHSLRLINSTACTVSNFTILGGPSMGVVESNGGGGHMYGGLRIVRDSAPSAALGLPPRLLATNADGFHSTTNRRGPLVLQSEISFTGDDLANVCCAMSVPLGPSAGPHGGPAALFVDTGNNLKDASAGDVIEFFNISTGVSLGSATIAATPTVTKDPVAVATMRSAYKTMMAPPISAHFVPHIESRFETGFPVTVPLTAQLPLDIAKGLWSVGVLQSTSNEGARVHDTKMHDGYARVLLVKSRNGSYLRNDFERAGGVHIGPEMVWLEGDPGLSDVTVADSKFDHIGDPPVSTLPSVATGHHIVVANNTDDICS
eukprot:CAMPEP_0182934556 /NCGR_PEP_ID=MMETSP0105_2-20130417/36350_1 /TAXON_ID=81532 ORGANISM="Acanthoeca-like sp., Strain 10tr" /NCGR_SAMPLE_ID=MMETSP0105_2 /ASSEMBLY_ACC=CAM_ASM_000205 /LENGTH=594 /DNA_ID=CAMNT_0025073419 /DNA_START=1 /DNA_END=1785 /DNA_ORIENTATION=-